MPMNEKSRINTVFKPFHLVFNGFRTVLNPAGIQFGAGNGIRTRDFQLGKLAFYR